MLTWLKRLFFGDERLFLSGSHLERVLRDDEFYSVPDEGDIVDGPNRCQLVLNYDRDGSMRLCFESEDSDALDDNSDFLSNALGRY
jgi:hypothetical protein